MNEIPKLAYQYLHESGRRYRLGPTNTNKVRLEINGVTTDTFASLSDAKAAAISDAENQPQHHAGMSEVMFSLTNWSEAMVVVDPEMED